jgi:hypothetical protein
MEPVICTEIYLLPIDGTLSSKLTGVVASVSNGGKISYLVGVGHLNIRLSSEGFVRWIPKWR